MPSIPDSFIVSTVNFYAIQVRSRSELRYMKLFAGMNPSVSELFDLHFPRRSLKVRRAGVTRQVEAAVFPGYLFVEAEAEDLAAHRLLFRRTDGFFRFLKSNTDIRPLEGRNLELVLHFVRKAGPVAGISRVIFDENSRIVVKDGPLQGLEGRIVKVDRRKRRAKVKLDLYEDTFAVDLAFEILESGK